MCCSMVNRACNVEWIVWCGVDHVIHPSHTPIQSSWAQLCETSMRSPNLHLAHSKHRLHFIHVWFWYFAGRDAFFTHIGALSVGRAFAPIMAFTSTPMYGAVLLGICVYFGAASWTNHFCPWMHPPWHVTNNSGHVVVGQFSSAIIIIQLKLSI